VLWCPPLALALACLQTVSTHRRHCCRAVRAPSQPAATHSPVNVL
jgi:hypothetical protein